MAGRRSGHSEVSSDGFTTIGWLFTVTLSILVFVTLANLAFVSYARGVLRLAADQAARKAAVADIPVDEAMARCGQRAQEVTSDLLAGLHDRHVECRVTGATVEARITGSMPFWLYTFDMVTFHFDEYAAATVETLP